MNRDELRRLPAVDDLLRHPVVAAWEEQLPRPYIVATVRDCVAEIRRRVAAGEPAPATDCWESLLAVALERASHHLFQPVINATGVVLHTNLGRAPLSAAAVAAMAAAARGYNNLELDLLTGGRGSRHIHGEVLLKLLTGAEAVMVVNNGAAAVLLALSALTAGREVILSRGEMIEIGGSFRMPEVMAQSGCLLREVGATNRTRLADYEQVLGPATAAILKVHTSNYRVIGFTGVPSEQELAELAHRHGVLFLEDLGSGVLVATEKYGLRHEPTVKEVLAAGADLVTCSGDKLLGGPQAGLIVGRRALVESCRRHPLARAVRVGKLTLAALQATLGEYLRGAHEQVPIWRMCALSAEEIRQRAAALAEQVTAGLAVGSHYESPHGIKVDVIPGESAIGGGSLPGEVLPTALLAISGQGRCAPDRLARRLRRQHPPVIGRVEADRLVFDLRTVPPEDDVTVATAVAAALRAALQDAAESREGTDECL